MDNSCHEIEKAQQTSCPIISCSKTKNSSKTVQIKTPDDDREKQRVSVTLAEVPKGQTTFDVVKEKFSFGLYKKPVPCQTKNSEQVCKYVKCLYNLALKLPQGIM